MALLGVAFAFAAVMPWVALGRIAWLRRRLRDLDRLAARSEARLQSLSLEARQLEESVRAAARS
jgi:hypothetical protein